MNPSRAKKFLAAGVVSLTLAVAIGRLGVVSATDSLHVDGKGRETPWTKCSSCHGSDLKGGIAKVSCMTCHNDFTSPNPPEPGHHLDGRNQPQNSCALCHGQDLTGNEGPSCFTCHGQLWSAPTNSPPNVKPGGPYFGPPNEDIQFDASGTTDADGDTLTYLWIFGDNTPPQFPSQVPTIKHKYKNAGNFTAKLTVLDGVNLPVIVDVPVTIAANNVNHPPTADAGGPYSPSAGQPVVFNGSGSSDVDGDTLTFSWDFDDGGTATGVNPSHTFAAPGAYVVTLSVTDGKSSPVVDTVNVLVLPPNRPPTADAGGPYSPIAGQATVFNGSGSSDLDGDALTYAWNFGDGGTATGVNPSHTFATPGAKVVTLSVTDGKSNPVIDTVNVLVLPSNRPPTAEPGGPYTGTVGQALSFDGSGSSDPDGDALTYQWEFGDGGSATGPKPTHTYQAAGTYTVLLTVSDGVNPPVGDIVDVKVNAAGPPPNGKDWSIMFPFLGLQGTLKLDKFFFILLVTEQIGTESKVCGVGYRDNTFVCWIDLKGAFFLGSQDSTQTEMNGMVFNFRGNRYTVWFASKPTANGSSTQNLLKGLFR